MSHLFPLILFLAACIITVLLWLVRSKNKTNYWYGGFIFALGLGLLAEFLDPIPNIQIAQYIKPIELLARFCSALSYRFCPYFLLLVGISVLKFTKPQYKKILYWLLLTPAFLSFIYDFLYRDKGFILVYLDYGPNFWFLALWGMAYGITGNLLLFYSFVTEKNRTEKFRVLMLFMITLPSFYPIYTAFILPLQTIGRHDFRGITNIFSLTVFLMFLVFAFKYGFLGIKLSIEKNYRENSLKLITSGTAILMHCVKNEISKIEYAGATIKKLNSGQPSSEVADIILESTDHLSKMVARIYGQVQEIRLTKEDSDIIAIIDTSLDSFKFRFDNKNMQLIKKYEGNFRVNCDKTHLKEAIGNIIKNAIEAMNQNGILHINVYRQKRFVKIVIRDNGTGILTENLPHVFEPFFSTKKTESNLGLGLSYCYNVIHKHNGLLEINSQEGTGTMVTLSLPIRSIKSN
jgi:signal transduction histidine kinase